MLRWIQNRVYSFVAKNQFFPSVAGAFVNPFFLCRRSLYHKLCEYAPRLSGKVLDFGCGTGPYRGLLTQTTEYAGLEYDTPENRLRKHADIFYDGETIPLDDASYRCDSFDADTGTCAESGAYSVGVGAHIAPGREAFAYSAVYVARAGNAV